MTASTAATPEPTDPQRTTAVTIKIVNNGPLQIKGPISLIDHHGNPLPEPLRRTVFLCRCGQSQSKPFCDGSHTRTNFTQTLYPAPTYDAPSGTAPDTPPHRTEGNP